MKLGELATRFVVGIFLGIIILVTIIPNDGIFFRIIYSAAVIVALYELETFAINKVTIVEQIVIYLSICSVLFLPHRLIMVGVLSATTTDVFAYVFGKFSGGNFIPGRPFPKISPNKTYEGCIFGVLFQAAAVLIFRDCSPADSVSESIAIFVLVLLGGAVAIFGDVLESYAKRLSDLKDSNDEIKEGRLLVFLEKLLGGRKGHGGYLDRLDSVSMTYCFIGAVYCVSELISLC